MLANRGETGGLTEAHIVLELVHVSLLVVRVLAPRHVGVGHVPQHAPTPARQLNHGQDQLHHPTVNLRTRRNRQGKESGGEGRLLTHVRVEYV